MVVPALVPEAVKVIAMALDKLRAVDWEAEAVACANILLEKPKTISMSKAYFFITKLLYRDYLGKIKIYFTAKIIKLIVNGKC